MLGFEYKVVVLPASHYEVDEEILNIQGESGWDLVSVVVDAKGYRVAYLKRRRRTLPDLESTADGAPSLSGSE